MLTDLAVLAHADSLASQQKGKFADDPHLASDPMGTLGEVAMQRVSCTDCAQPLEPSWRHVIALAIALHSPSRCINPIVMNLPVHRPTLGFHFADSICLSLRFCLIESDNWLVDRCTCECHSSHRHWSPSVWSRSAGPGDNGGSMPLLLPERRKSVISILSACSCAAQRLSTIYLATNVSGHCLHRQIRSSLHTGRN